MKTTVYIQKKDQLRCKMVISKKNCMYNNKASRAYHLRKFCGSGNGEPNNTLKNVECSETTTSSTRTSNASPVSRGRTNKMNPHPGEGAASRRA
jgi:hypothetical protein